MLLRPDPEPTYTILDKPLEVTPDNLIEIIGLCPAGLHAMRPHPDGIEGHFANHFFMATRLLTGNGLEITLDGEHVGTVEWQAKTANKLQVKVYHAGRAEYEPAMQAIADHIVRKLEGEPTANQAASEQNNTRQATTKHWSTRLIAIALIVLGVLIALVINVASSTLPKEWEPYLWLSWPLLGVLVMLSIFLVHRQNGTSETHGA